MKEHYLDYAASTPIFPKVLEVLEETMKKDFANPSAAHLLGFSLNQKIETIRSFFLEKLGSSHEDHFVFTSSATESNNMILKGFNWQEGDSVAFFLGDHPSLVQPALSLRAQGVETFRMRINPAGEVSLDDVHPERIPRLVVLAHVNNLSGVEIDLEKVSQAIRHRWPETHIHIDGVQSFTKVALKVREWGIDSLTISSHKIGGPKGIAGLYLKRNTEISPLLLGGDQEDGFRAGTVSYPLIRSFQKATEEALEASKNCFSLWKEMNQVCREKLSKDLKAIHFPFSLENTVPTILYFVHRTCSSDIIVRHLEERGIYVSTLSACSSKKNLEVNPTLTALGLKKEDHSHTLRISWGWQSSFQDIDALVESLIAIQEKLQIYESSAR